jgi:hypothetical protein
VPEGAGSVQEGVCWEDAVRTAILYFSIKLERRNELAGSQGSWTS